MKSSVTLLTRAARVAAFLLPLLILPPALPAESAPPAVRFDIPAGEARPMLRQFAAQSGREIIIPVELVAGVRTNAIEGVMTAEAALEAMLAGTGLVPGRDDRTGAFAIRREDPREKNADRRRAGSLAAADGLPFELDEFTVNGVRVPGPVNEGVIARLADRAVPFQIFDRAALERSGVTSLGDFFRSYPGNTTAGLGEQSAFGAAANLASGPGDTGDRINLRGLGSSRTVVLLNGRRLYGSDSLGPDISRIPLSAIERVEVLPGASAALYGANAVGGAVNVITRRNYRATEASLYAGTSTGGGASEWRATLSHGFALNHGRTTGLLVLEHNDRGALRARQREFYRDALGVVPADSALYRTINALALRTPRALVATTSPSGLLIPGQPGATVASVPVGYNVGAPTAADFAATAGQLPLSFRRVGAVLLRPATTVDSVNFQGEHRLIPDRLEAYTELAWRYQARSTALPGIGGTTNLSATSPLNPFRANPGAGRPTGVAVSVAWDPVDVPFDEVYALQRTVRLVGGLKGRLGEAKRWAWALDYSFDRNEAYSTVLQRSASLNDAVNLGEYVVFRDLERFPNTINLDRLTSRVMSRSTPEIQVANARVSGDLFEWRAGRVALSGGVELRREDIDSVGVQDFAPVRREANPSGVALLGPLLNGETTARREARAAYLELVLPVLGGDLRLPLAEQVEVSLAARRESYGRYHFRSTFGAGNASTVQPEDIAATPLTAAVLWRVSRDLALRASYSDAFVSPTMGQFFNPRNSLPNSSSSTFFDPQAGTTVTRPPGTVMVTTGGNPFLRPESGRSYNYGVVLTPRGLPGLNLTADLFHVVSYDQIRTPSVQTVLSYFPERVTRDAAGQVTSYDISGVNMSEVVVSGLELAARWEFDVSGVGTVSWQGGATYADTYKQRAIVGNPFLEGVGDRTLDSGVPLRWKATSSVTLARDRWSAGLTARFTDRYKDAFNSGVAVPNNNGGVDGAYIRAQLELDARLTYTFGEAEGWRGALADTRVALGIHNLLDRRPPYLSTNSGAPYYSYYNDPRMRFVYLELKREF